MEKNSKQGRKTSPKDLYIYVKCFSIQKNVNSLAENKIWKIGEQSISDNCLYI